MKNDISLDHVPIAAFAREDGQASGSVPLAGFTRLLDESAAPGGQAPASVVDYALQAHMRQDASGAEEPWLQLHAQTVLRQVCQRCLGEVDVPITVDRSFRFVASEELAAVEDEESEEDVLVLSKAFNVLELMEDELLLALPLVPMHAVCPQPVTLAVADPDFAQAQPEKPHPFAVLDQLKGKAG